MAKILVVDDDPNVALLVKMTLSKSRDYQIDIASNGHDALDKIGAAPPDLVLLDLMMPGIDGMEVCRRVKSDEKLKYIPVIMLTAKREAGDMIRGMDMGANDYITKPFNPEELLARVRVHLRIKSLEREAAANRELSAVLKMSVTLQHEINNPLTGIIGNVDLLKEWDRLTDHEREDIVATIHASALRIKEIIRQMGKITRIISIPYAGTSEMIDIDRSSGPQNGDPAGPA